MIQGSGATGVRQTVVTSETTEKGQVEGMERLEKAVDNIKLDPHAKPESADSAAPDMSPAKKAAVMYFAQNLLQPNPSASAVVTPPETAGAIYLAEQQASRQNQEPAKEAYDTVFTKAEAFVEMQSVKQAISQLPEPEDNPGKAIHRTLVSSDVHLAEMQQSDWSGYSKIYIPGAGNAGSARIVQGIESLSARDVAMELLQSGALDHVKDIRVTSSGSGVDEGDGSETTAVQSQALLAQFGATRVQLGGMQVGAVADEEGAGAPEGQDVAGSGIRFRSDRGLDPYQGFAKTLAQAIAELGYGDVTVTGYRGEEQPIEDASRQHHMRRVDGEPRPRSAADVKIRFSTSDHMPEGGHDEVDQNQ